MTFVSLQRLNLKLPPVLAALIFALLMWLISRVLPATSIAEYARWVSIVVLLVAGAYFALAGVVSFKKAQTTVNPLKPDECSSLVTSGVFQRSRNPMYLGLLFLLIAWGLFLSNLFSVIFAAGFPLYMNRFQIRPEERALLSLYGQDYSDYMNKARRWL